MEIVRRTSSKTLAELKLSFAESQIWTASQEHGETPIFLASQVVAGQVHIGYLGASRYQPGDKVQIDLTGTYTADSWIATNTAQYSWIRKSVTKQILHTRKILPVGSTESNPAFSTFCNLGFEFQACTNETIDITFGRPDAPAEYDCFQSEHSSTRYTSSWSIPSTSITKFPLPGHVQIDDEGYVEVSIRYQLTAVLLRDVSLVPLARLSKEIAILDDSHGIEPPTCIADYPNEYRLFTPATVRSSSIARNLVSKISRRQNTPPPPPAPQLLVHGSEPTPLVFRRPQQYATTSVPIKLEFFNHHGNEKNPPLKDGVKITWRLQQSRYSSLDGLKGIPTRKQLNTKNDRVVCRTVLDKKTVYTCQVGQWQLGSANSKTCSKKQQLAPLESVLNDDDALFSPHNNQPYSSSTKSSYVQSPEKPLSAPPYLETETESEAVGAASQIPTRTTTMSIPISIPLSSFKQPTSTTSYMVIRYSLSIDICIPLNGTTMEKQDLHDHHINAARHSRESHSTRKNSWTVEAHLDIPIQLVYSSSQSGHSTYPWSDSTLLDVDTGTIEQLSTDEEIKDEPEESYTQNESARIFSDNTPATRARRLRQDSRIEETLPTYKESISDYPNLA